MEGRAAHASPAREERRLRPTERRKASKSWKRHGGKGRGDATRLLRRVWWLGRVSDRVASSSRGAKRVAGMWKDPAPTRAGNRSSRNGSPTETRRTSFGAGCNTSASQRVSAAGQPDERHLSERIARKVQLYVVGAARSRPRGPGVGQPARRGTAAARASTRAGGATLRANDSPPGARGNSRHRPGSAAPTSVGAVARTAACPSSAISRRPRGKGRTNEREGARASATCSNGGWRRSKESCGTGGVSDGRATERRELLPRLGPARTRAGNVGQVHEGASRAVGYSSRGSMLQERETRDRQPETVKANGSGEPTSHYRSRQEGVAAGPPPRRSRAP